MAYNFLPSGRDQASLLPPDLREWLPADHLAWFVRDVVDQLDLGPFLAAYRADGHSRAAYEPRTLLGVLLYAYATGVRSSRQIERRCVEDLAFRVLAGNSTPDHVTIARFRARHEQAWPASWSPRSGCAPKRGCCGWGWWRWTAPRWPATPPPRPTAPWPSSRKKSPRSCARPPRPTSVRTSCTAPRAATNSRPSWPARPAGWPGCGRPRPAWKRRPPSGSAATSSGSPNWPPRPRTAEEGGAGGGIPPPGLLAILLARGAGGAHGA